MVQVIVIGMSELAAAGAALITLAAASATAVVQDDDGGRSHLAEPENDSLSSEEEDEEAIIAKSKTLPGRGRVVNGLKKSHSLKRSITLPRNPFVKKSKKAIMRGHMEDMEEVSENGGSPTKSLVRTHSVRNFFHRFVNQVSSASALAKSRRAKTTNNKYEACEERIAAWKKKFTAEDRVPGVVGIRNHGNTCFINAILQCLSYTDILAEYFVLDTYKCDLKRKRRLQALTTLHKRRSGSDICGGARGEVTEQLATMLKSLWSLQYEPEISVRFKALVEKHASQYKGGSQHDAQEFLLWLLDQVHEDLNVAPRRRYRCKSPNGQNGQKPSDEVLAAEALANYMRCNNSFVMDVFQAQFRSSLTCPTCERQSNTFDPFVCVSLPIPHKQLMPVYVTVLYIDQCPRQVKLGLTVGVHETIGDLRNMLSKDTGIPEAQILLTEVDDLTFRRTFRDSQPVTVIKQAKKSSKILLYCIEVPHHKEANEDDGAFVVLTWVNVLKEGPIEKRFGSPYTTQVSRETLYDDLQKLLMKEMSSILHDDILISAQKVPLFKIRVVDGFDEPTYLDSTVDLPMYTLAVEQAVNYCSTEGVEVIPHVKLALEWDAPAKSQIIADDSDPVEEHSSVKQVEKSPEEANSVTLQECFSLYTRAEKLGDGDAWFCPECKRKQEVVKRMGLWSLPDVLIIHLKRFRQGGGTGGGSSGGSGGSGCNKLSTLVDFPLEGYDMTPFVSNRDAAASSASNSSGQSRASSTTCDPPPHQAATGLKNWSSVLSYWRKDKRELPQLSVPSAAVAQPPSSAVNTNHYMYDLYAVCNHHGNDLQGGHYTATCRNPTDGHWYTFDDMHTRKVDERDVVTQDAYILFYQRQSLSSSGASSSSASSSSSSSAAMQEHWVYRMPDFTFKAKNGMTTKQQQAANIQAVTTGRVCNKPAATTTTTTATAKADDDATTASDAGKDSFQRNNPKYATLPAKRHSEVIQCDNGHHSEGEQAESEDDDDDVTVTEPEPKGEEKEVTEEVVETVVEKKEDEDVTRPIDKNDVD